MHLKTTLLNLNRTNGLSSSMTTPFLLFVLFLSSFEINASLFGNHVVAGIFGSRGNGNQNENGEVYANKIESNVLLPESKESQYPPPPRTPPPQAQFGQQDNRSDRSELTVIRNDDYQDPMSKYESQSLNNLDVPPSFDAESWSNMHHQNQNHESQIQPGYYDVQSTQSIDSKAFSFDGQHNEAHYLLQTMENDLFMSLQREQAMMDQINNLTKSLSNLERREKLHLHQLDLLTERFIDLEMQRAKDQNTLMEYRANCTDLALEIAILEGNVEEWRVKCSELVQIRDENKKSVASLKLKLKQASRKSEEMALLVENHRLQEDAKASELRSGTSKVQRGFFSWVFGLFNSRDADDDDKKELYDMARSTLMTALQIERNNVEELETALAQLQRNYTVTSDQVQSRDAMISELNGRAAILSEDKAVLKAALRQLRKEMSDEADRTKKILDEVEVSKNESSRLQNEISSIIASHKSEIERLNKKIQKKDDTIVILESNLTSITQYVSKLEERLADFMVTRRDLDQQNENYALSTKLLVEMQQERESDIIKIQELEQEREEIKRLLDLLAKERVQLIKQNNLTVDENNAMKANENGLRSALSKLKVEAKELKDQNSMLNEQCTKLEIRISAAGLVNENLQKGYNNATAEVARLRVQVDSLLKERSLLQERLSEAEKSKMQFHQKISDMQCLIETAEKQKLDAQNTAKNAEIALQQEVNEKNSQVEKFSREFIILADEVKNAENAWKAEKERMIEESQRVIAKMRTELESSASKTLNAQNEERAKASSADENRRLQEEKKLSEDAVLLRAEAKQLEKEKKEFGVMQQRENAKLVETAIMLQQEKDKFVQLVEAKERKANEIKNETDLLFAEKSNIEKSMRTAKEELQQMKKLRETEEKKKLEIIAQIEIERKNLELERKRLINLKKLEPVPPMPEGFLNATSETLSAACGPPTKSKISRAEVAVNVTVASIGSSPRNVTDQRHRSVPNITTPANQNSSTEFLSASEANISARVGEIRSLPTVRVENRGEIQRDSRLNCSNNRSAELSKGDSSLVYHSNNQKNSLQRRGPRQAIPIPIEGSNVSTSSQFINTPVNVSNSSAAHHFQYMKKDLRPQNRKETSRKVPFRKIRKLFAKATGFHGTFTKPSVTHKPNQTKPVNYRPPPLRNATQSVTVSNATRNQVNQTSSIPNTTKFANAAASVNTTTRVPPNVSINSRTDHIRNKTGTMARPKPIQNYRKLQTKNIPLRKVRKFLSSVTGIHGVFSKPSSQRFSAEFDKSSRTGYPKHGAFAKAELSKTGAGSTQDNHQGRFNSSQKIPGSQSKAYPKPNLIKPSVSGPEYPDIKRM